MSLMFIATLMAGAWIAKLWVDHQRACQRRAHIFDACTGLLDEPTISRAPDGFPRLSGRIGSEVISLGLIPDSLTIKRLPQLWVSFRTPCRSSFPDFSITARPRQDDFFSDAPHLPHRVEVPDWLPQDLAIRCGAANESSWLDRLRSPLEELFEDPLVKEVSLARRGLRLVYRLAEGDRGQHLLLRRSAFDAALTSEMFTRHTKFLTAVVSLARPDRSIAA